MSETFDIKKVIDDGEKILFDSWAFDVDARTLDHLRAFKETADSFLAGEMSKDPASNFHHGRLAGFAECLEMIIDYNQRVNKFKETMKLRTIQVLVKLYEIGAPISCSDMTKYLSLSDAQIIEAISPALECGLARQMLVDGVHLYYQITPTGERYIHRELNFAKDDIKRMYYTSKGWEEHNE